MSQNVELLQCPVCKDGVTLDSLVPVYSGNINSDPRGKDFERTKRPQSQKEGTVFNDNYAEPGGFSVSTSMGFSMLPGLFFSLVSYISYFPLGWSKSK